MLLMQCPIAKETYNNFQDDDGCPDSVSGFLAFDFDGDGISDLNDKCPLEPEVYNDYQDHRWLSRCYGFRY